MPKSYSGFGSVAYCIVIVVAVLSIHCESFSFDSNNFKEYIYVTTTFVYFTYQSFKQEELGTIVILFGDVGTMKKNLIFT